MCHCGVRCFLVGIGLIEVRKRRLGLLLQLLLGWLVGGGLGELVGILLVLW